MEYLGVVVLMINTLSNGVSDVLWNEENGLFILNIPYRPH